MKKIDFDSLDKQSVVILCHKPDNVADIKCQLETKGYRVVVETSTTNFMTHIDKAKPGFVLISKKLQTPLALQLPSFLQKKYRIPVMLFGEKSPEDHINEHLSQPVASDLANQAPQDVVRRITGQSSNKAPEIINLQSDANSEDVAEKISTFEENYKKQFAPSRPASESLTKKAIKEIENSIVKPSSVIWTPDQPLALHSLNVKDPAGDGYFIIALPETGDHLNQEYLISDLESQIQEHLGVEAVIDELTTQVKYSQYLELTKNSDKVVKGLFGNNEIMLAFTQKAPDADLTAVHIIDDAFLVPIEKWWTEIPLNFRVYHYMPLNNRKLLYVKQGKMLQPESFKRFQSRGVKQMLIPAEELDAYRRMYELMEVAHSTASKKAGSKKSEKEAQPMDELAMLLASSDDSDAA